MRADSTTSVIFAFRSQLYAAVRTVSGVAGRLAPRARGAGVRHLRAGDVCHGARRDGGRGALPRRLGDVFQPCRARGTRRRARHGRRHAARRAGRLHRRPPATAALPRRPPPRRAASLSLLRRHPETRRGRGIVRPLRARDPVAARLRRAVRGLQEYPSLGVPPAHGGLSGDAVARPGRRVRRGVRQGRVEPAAGLGRRAGAHVARRPRRDGVRPVRDRAGHRFRGRPPRGDQDHGGGAFRRNRQGDRPAVGGRAVSAARQVRLCGHGALHAGADGPRDPGRHHRGLVHDSRGHAGGRAARRAGDERRAGPVQHGAHRAGGDDHAHEPRPAGAGARLQGAGRLDAVGRLPAHLLEQVPHAEHQLREPAARPHAVRELREHERLPPRRRVGEGRHVDVPGRLSLPSGGGARDHGDAAPARGRPQRVHGRRHGAARARPARRSRLSVHQAERPPRAHPRAALQPSADHRDEQRSLHLPRAPLRGVAQLRLLGEPRR